MTNLRRHAEPQTPVRGRIGRLVSFPRAVATGPKLATGGGRSPHRAELPVSQFPRGAYLPSKYLRINSRLRSLEAYTQTITAPPPRHYRFLLSDRCAIRRVAAGSDILD